MDYTRNNQNFWETFTQELSEEINLKGLLNPFIDKIGKSKNKEDGHSFAQSYVDFLIREVLPKSEVLKKHGFTIEDSIKEREHGDFYLTTSENVKITISSNGKFGISEKLGYPNMCSIERAVKYLKENNLPYLVFKLRKVKGNFTFKVFDLFNNLDIMSYNDGPGQIMISESKFFKKKEFKYSKTNEAVIYLCNMNEKAYHNLLESRIKRYKDFQNIKKQYERSEI